MAVFAFSFSMAIGAVLTPGPVTTVIISQSPRLGWKTGWLISIGHAIIELIMALFIVFGLSTFLGSQSAQTAIAILGGIFLLWMGGSMLFRVYQGKMTLHMDLKPDETYSNIRLLGLGIITSLSNPFWYVWWMTAAAVYLLEAKTAGWLIVAGFYFGHIGADFTWNIILSGLVGSGKRVINDRVYAGLIGVCALFLIFLAIKFLLTGLQGTIG